MPSLENLDSFCSAFGSPKPGISESTTVQGKFCANYYQEGPHLIPLEFRDQIAFLGLERLASKYPISLSTFSLHNESNCESLAEFLGELLTQTQQLSSLSVADDFQLFSFAQGETSRMDVLQHIATWAIAFPEARSLRMGIEYPAEQLARCFCDSSNAELQHFAVKCMDDATPFLQK